MTLLVLAVSQTAVVLGADELHVELATSSRTLVRKVFEGSEVVGGMAGTADTDAGSLIASVRDAVNAATSLPHAVALFEQTTTPFLAAAVSQWRTWVGPEPDLSEFATMVLAGVLNGHTAGIVLWCAMHPHGPRWHRGELVVAGPISSFVDAYSGVTPSVYRRTSRAHLDFEIATLTRQSPDDPPTELPSATAAGQEVVAFVRDTVERGIADEASLPRPTYWPGGPVLAGVPQVVGLEFLPARCTTSAAWPGS